VARNAAAAGVVEPVRGRLWEPLLDLIFPPHCVACGTMGSWFCPACRDRVQRQEPPLCERCGRPITSGTICGHCRRHPLAVDGLRSVALHRQPLSKAIHALKYGGVRVLAAPLGALMAEYAIDLGLVADALVPVPLHRARERQRGYNQSHLLAREMSVVLRWPVVEALARLRNTPAQVGLNRAQRLDNVRDAFCATDASVAGRRVLLIDDVCTTGATLGACSQALRRAGARSVWALTLARAVDIPAKPQP